MAIDWENYGRDRDRNSKTSSYRSQSYVDGNTVRKANAVPKHRERIEPVRRTKQYPQRKPVRMPGISGASFVFVMCMLCAVIYFGFSYLTTQSETRQTKEKVIAIQSEIATQKEENAEKYQMITNSVSLSEIYERATKKLKMVQAKNNQIYTYKNKKSNMVKQYADIPGADD